MRNFDDEQAARSFAGSLLVAHPNMLDPNFRRAVLFIYEHDSNEGWHGALLQRLGNRPLRRLFPRMAIKRRRVGRANAVSG